MDTVAERILVLDQEQSAAEVKARAQMLRALIVSIPPHQRAAVLDQVKDLIPKTPKRGGEILNNVFELFKREPTAERGAPEVQSELKKVGMPAEMQTVRNALTYLEGRRILQRVGYGLYRMGDGSLREGPPG